MKTRTLRSHYFFIFILVITLFSCEEILMEKDISQETVQLLAPANNAQFFSTGVTFTWESVANATGYKIQIAKPDFINTAQIILDTTITNTSYIQQLPIGEYQWRVKAVNNSYSTTYSQRALYVVSTDDFQNNTVVLTSPSNNFITKTAQQSLSWESIIGATNYQLQISNSSNVLVLDQSTTNTTYNYTFPEGSYLWKVRATNGTSYTLYSSRAILVDLTPPNVPNLINPVNSSTLSSGNVSFQWSRTPINGSSEKDSIYIYTNSTLTNLESKTQATSPYTKTLSSGTYYWRVKAFDSAGNVGNTSATANFTIN